MTSDPRELTLRVRELETENRELRQTNIRLCSHADAAGRRAEMAEESARRAWQMAAAWTPAGHSR